jgi:hypothetical protein
MLSGAANWPRPRCSKDATFDEYLHVVGAERKMLIERPACADRTYGVPARIDRKAEDLPPHRVFEGVLVELIGISTLSRH